MRTTMRNIKYAAGIALGVAAQLVMIVLFGFTSLEIPFLVYVSCWAVCIAIIKWAAGKLPE